MNWLELVAAVIGFVYIVLEYRASAWLWLFSILSAMLYVWEFYSNGVYANMLIQVYYLVVGIYGWLEWKGLLKKKKSQEVAITSMPKKYYLPVVAISLALCCVFPMILKHFTDSTVWFWDGISTALSVVAMWLLVKKFYQQWIFWIIVEPLVVLTSIQAEMYFTAVLYLFYTVIAIMGYFKWKKEAVK
ncbi:MAG: nicotinamide mononucleotide transporter [Bacteroidales bacterium]|jgi:nicotinamide mononucleotide transporter|nr:nicotinamide mononucleotide transporter [Bacteroidales bacterium]